MLLGSFREGAPDGGRVRESACMISYGLNIISGNRAYRIYASLKFRRYRYCTQAPSTATRSPTGSPSRRCAAWGSRHSSRRERRLDDPLSPSPTIRNAVGTGVPDGPKKRKPPLRCHPRTERSVVKDLRTWALSIRCVLFSEHILRQKKIGFITSTVRRSFTPC